MSSQGTAGKKDATAGQTLGRHGPFRASQHASGA